MRLRQKGDGGRSYNAGTLHRSSGRYKARSKSSGYPITGLASVHAKQNAWRWRHDSKGTSEGKPNRIYSLSIERRLANDGANAIGSKKLLHEWSVSVTLAGLRLI